MASSGCRPRGMTKERLQADIWPKDATPSIPLRKWFNHDHFKWEVFKSRYFSELNTNPRVVKQLLELISK